MAILVAVAGAGLGSAIGIGSSTGWLIGSVVGNLLFPTGGEDTVNEGPRLGDLTVTSAAYGAPRQIGFGTIRQGGNMIWTAGIQEHKNTRKTTAGKGGGGSSQTTITYSYSATFAIAFGEGIADDVLRIWGDGKLIFDKRGTGTATRKRGLSFRFYPGDEDQLPDSAIQAAEGEDLSPAHRGTVYIVFDNLPLADFGNRIPSITAEIAYAATQGRFAVKSTRYPDGVTLVNKGMFTVDFDRQIAYAVSSVDNVLRRVNLVSMIEDRQVDGEVTFQTPSGEVTAWSGNALALMPDGGLITTADGDGGGNTEPIVRIDPTALVETDRFGVSSNDLGMSTTGFGVVLKYAAVNMWGLAGELTFLLCADLNDDLGILTYPDLRYVWDTNTFPTNLQEEVKSLITGLKQEGSGEAYSIHAGAFPVTTSLYIYKITVSSNANYESGLGAFAGVGVELVTSFMAAELIPGETSLGEAGTSGVYDEIDNTIMFFVQKGSNAKWIIVKFDPSDATIVWRSEELDDSPGDDGGALNNSRVQGDTFGFFNVGGNGVQINTQTGVLLHNGEAPDWSINVSIGARGVYDSSTESWISLTNVGENSVVGRWFFNRGVGEAAPLSDIVTTLCERADMLATDLDVSDLVGIDVPGFLVGRQSSARQAIETLSQVYFFDGVESDFLLKFVLRGQDPIRTITEDELATIDNKTGEFIRENREQEVELPERFTITYMDKDQDYSQNSHSAKRMLFPTPTMYSHNQLGLDAAIALSSDFAKQQAEKALYSSWVERMNYELRLAWTHLDLDPTDVVNIVLNDGTTFRTRITQFDVGAGFTIDLVTLSEETTQFVSTVTADSGSGVPSQTVIVAEIIKTLLLDAPLLRDADETPARAHSPLYFFMGGYQADQFTRGSLYKSSDDVVYESAGDLLSGMSWGASQHALADPPFDNPYATDTVNSLTVFMNTGAEDLESVTQLQMLNGANAAALMKVNGEVEIIQYKDVVENSNGSFTLSNLLRGRRGTDAMTNDHTPGETFLMLFAADGEKVPLELSEKDAVRYYRGAGGGQLIEEASRQTVTSVHRALMPYAPVLVKAAVNATDIDITWQRRTRVGGALQDYQDTVPLSEDSEEYTIVALDAPGGSIVRTITSISTVAYTYLNADLITDYGSVPSQLFLRVYQISAQVGRGFVREVTVDVE